MTICFNLAQKHKEAFLKQNKIFQKIKVFCHSYNNSQQSHYLHCYSEEHILVSGSETVREISAVQYSAFSENSINSND